VTGDANRSDEALLLRTHGRRQSTIGPADMIQLVEVSDGVQLP